MSLAVQTLKNTVFSAVGYIVPMFFSFIVTPLLVKELGVGAYGVYVFIATWTGFLLLADLGLGMSLMKSVSESFALGDKERMQNVVSVAVFVFGAFASLGFIVFAILALFSEKWFSGLGISPYGLRVAFLLGGLVFAVSSLNQLFIALIRGLNRFDVVVRNSLMQLLLFNSVILVLVFIGKLGLLWVLVANFATSLLTLVLLVSWFWKNQPTTNMRPRFHKTEVVRMYKFGMAAFVTNLSNNTLTQLDRIIIPFLVGAVRTWEQGVRNPGGAASKIIRYIKDHPGRAKELMTA
jgi:O-antigen/teichoic acid export membrane protein